MTKNQRNALINQAFTRIYALEDTLNKLLAADDDCPEELEEAVFDIGQIRERMREVGSAYDLKA